MSNATTMIPTTYPALEAEVYASLDFATERETIVPAAEEQLGLEADCFVGDRDPVEVEVDEMFADEGDAAPFCPCETCVPGNVTCVNRD